MTNTEAPTLQLTPTAELGDRARRALERCGAVALHGGGPVLEARSPVTGESLFEFGASTPSDARAAIGVARERFLQWRSTPAPARGALVKRLGQLLEQHLEDIGELISIEAGKIRAEAQGEVQEMIDICDLAVGLSRQIGGQTMPSERPGHRLMETWHPLGVVGVISSFNFPAAVWSWNTAIALVCGNTVVWKPSPATSLTAVACSALLDRAAEDCSAPVGLNQLVLGGADVGEVVVDSPDVALVSATGSEGMGAAVAPRVAARFGRCLLELGGNNASIVTSSANLDLAARGIVFAAAGTAGQRCTTLRRLIVHEDVADDLCGRIQSAYASLPIGDPLSDGTLVGPLINAAAFDAMNAAVEQAMLDGGAVIAGGRRHRDDSHPDAYYVDPVVIRMPAQTEIVRQETFAPILYVMTFRDIDEAIAIHNDVPQGLSSSVFTGDQREAERFLASDGSDCGIANVNIGTSGAEIGGAFGGEKTTGGGRESGSDAWRAYMRRATNTINYSAELPLAQGISFG